MRVENKLSVAWVGLWVGEQRNDLADEEWMETLVQLVHCQQTAAPDRAHDRRDQLEESCGTFRLVHHQIEEDRCPIGATMLHENLEELVRLVCLDDQLGSARGFRH